MCFALGNSLYTLIIVLIAETYSIINILQVIITILDDYHMSTLYIPLH